MLPPPRVNPAKSFDEALQRVAAFKALDDASILPAAHTALLDHGARTPIAVVLFHGYTNNPGQYVELGPLVHARGANVFIPRLPEQGDKDRMTTRIAKLTAGEMLRSATEAVDIACGLGERVMMLGISSSGVLCGFYLQYRSDVARAVLVDPFFAMLKFSYPVSSLVGAAMRVLPNFFMWWDPRDKGAHIPRTAYPRFATHSLGQCLLVSDDVYRAAKAQPFAGGSAVVVTNRTDPAVNNAVAAQVASAWRSRRPNDVTTYEFTDLPTNHDILDPRNDWARTEEVYPKLLELLFA